MTNEKGLKMPIKQEKFSVDAKGQVLVRKGKESKNRFDHRKPKYKVYDVHTGELKELIKTEEDSTYL